MANKCKICGKEFKDIDFLTAHIEKVHEDEIPKDMSAAQYEYLLRTGKEQGFCVMCKKPTEFNDQSHKFDRFCTNPKCKDEYREIFKQRMIGKYGKVHLLDDPQKQREMLANRHTSGVYEFNSDSNFKISYASSYELHFLQMLDNFMNLSGNDIMGPSPHTYYYVYNGEKKFYIPDFYIPSLNLEIEIKDGDSETGNKHPKIAQIDRVKEKLKDETMATMKNKVTYIKILNKDYTQFFKLIFDLRDKEVYLNKAEKSAVTESMVGDFLYGMVTSVGQTQDLYANYKYHNAVLNFKEGSKELERRIRNAAPQDIQEIEKEIGVVKDYLKTISGDKKHRLQLEAIKELEYIERKLEPLLDSKKERLLENCSMLEYFDIVVESISKLPMVPNTRMRPIYILLTYTRSTMSNLIRFVTGEAYSHSSISFDTSMKKLYSFGRKEAKDQMKFIEEDIFSGVFKDLSETTYSLYMVMVPETAYTKCMEKLEWFKMNADNLKYNTIGLINLALGKETHLTDKYFCSEFIAHVLKEADPSLVRKDPSLTTPVDLVKSNKMIFVTKGKLRNYNRQDTDNKIKQILIQRGYGDVTQE